MDKIVYKYAVKECEQNLERNENKYTFAIAGKNPAYALHSSYIIRHALRACAKTIEKNGN